MPSRDIIDNRNERLVDHINRRDLTFSWMRDER